MSKKTGVFITLDSEGNEVELYPEGTLGSDNSVTLTRAEYDALSDAEKNSDTTYYISDEDAQPNAFSVPFTSDKYTASNTGDALIEVKTELEETNSNLVTELQSGCILAKNVNTVTMNGFSTNIKSLKELTIPTDYRPNQMVIAPLLLIYSNKTYLGYIEINTNGSILAYFCTTYASIPSSADGGTVNFSASWTV